MKAKELIKMGFPQGPIINIARAAAGAARIGGRSTHQVRSILEHLLREPEQFIDDAIFGKLAQTLVKTENRPRPSTPREPQEYHWNESLTYKVWGRDIDADTHRQMRNACKLPISVAGALMPDAHVGYGLPIGGVLATVNAVIPYAVGVDIACRMMLTVFELPPTELIEHRHRFIRILEENTRFGVGSEWKIRRDHPVMDEDWRISRITSSMKDLAHRQLGTSGSGNHFVEFGEFTLTEPVRGVPAGQYLAVLSHSGSRGPGNQIASYYSRWAMTKHKNMPKELRHLAWLDMEQDGAEYWEAMQLMGKFASANHHVIHRQIVAAVGLDPLLQVENHHNFAWREIHNGREVIVHRKGATPAGQGILGIIPGSMATPAYLVEGLGENSSLHSASHGAGRRMSRTEAFKKNRWPQVKHYLEDRGVTLLSAGLDEAPWVYKDIDEVMTAQADLVRPLARFMPRIVKMSPAGERPED